MKHFLFLLLITGFMMSCSKQQNSNNESTESINIEKLQKIQMELTEFQKYFLEGDNNEIKLTKKGVDLYRQKNITKTMRGGIITPGNMTAYRFQKFVEELNGGPLKFDERTGAIIIDKDFHLYENYSKLTSQ